MVQIKSTKSLINIISLVSFVCGLTLWLAIFGPDFDTADYVFRPLAMLPLLATVINTGLIIFLYRRIQPSETGFWFLAFLGTTTFWSLAEFLQRSSGVLEVSIFWRSLAVYGWAIMPIAYLFFTLSYVDRQVLIRRLHLQIGLFLIVSSLIYAQFKTHLTVSSDYVLQSWGYDSPNGGYINIFTVWLLAVFLTGLALFIHEYKNAVSQQKRKQIRIFIISLLVPLVGGTSTDLVLPNLFDVNIIPMAAFLTAVEGMILSYGVYRHGLFSINPVSLSGEIMKTLPQPVIGTNEKFQIQFMNANATEMFKQHAPFVGKSIYSLVGAENFKIIKEELGKTAQDAVTNIPRIPLGLDGGVVIAQAQISSIGKGLGYIFAMSNITQQVLSMRIIEKEVRIRTQLYNQEKARLFSSVNGLRQGFLIADVNSKITLMNIKAQEMFPEVKISDVQSGNVVDNNAISILEKSLSNFGLREKLASVIRNNQYLEFEEVDMGQSILDIEILPISAPEGAIGAVVLLDDVTERTMIERSKDEFFSIASHELRTPLTAIRGNTSMMLSYYSEQLKDPELREMVDDVYSSSIRLIEIVNDFLDTSRLEQGRMVFEPKDISLSKVIKEVAKETNAVAKEKGNTIIIDGAIDGLPEVRADFNKLKQIMYNLVGNSLKFTDKGTVTIRTKIEESSVRVSISDTGKGISEDNIKLLFRKFQQAESNLLTRDATKGTGLGLYISKLIIENMKGTIGLESSKVGEGSTFFFTVPLAKPKSIDSLNNNV